MIVLASFLFARLETLPLALQDFMPVAAAAAGCWFIARFVRRVRPEFAQVALVGAASVVAGGASKAAWKLIRAPNGPDFKWLDAAFFPFLAWGFALPSWPLIHVDYTETGGTPRPLGAWKVPVGLR